MLEMGVRKIYGGSSRYEKHANSRVVWGHDPPGNFLKNGCQEMAFSVGLAVNQIIFILIRD